MVTSAKILGPRLSVSGRVGDKVIEVAFDTQSTGSLVSKDLQEYGTSFIGSIDDIVFGDHKGRSCGSMNLQVSIEDLVIDLDAVVVSGLAVPVVIGFPDMIRLKVNFDGEILNVRNLPFCLGPSGFFEPIVIPIQDMEADVNTKEVKKSETNEIEKILPTPINLVAWGTSYSANKHEEMEQLMETPYEESEDMVRLEPPPVVVSEESNKETMNQLKAIAGEDPILKEFVLRNAELFQDKLTHPGSAKVYHRIDTGNASPAWEPPRRRSEEKQRFLLDICRDWQHRGVIEPCKSSEWSANIHCAADSSKPGGYRPCGDYRQLNKKTIPDRYPSDCMDTIYDFIRTADILTVGDGVEGYFTIPIHPNDRHKTAVHLPTSMETDGLFQLKVCLFGLRNAGATFDRWMNNVLAPFGDACSLRDDVFIRTRKKLNETEEQLKRRHIEEVEKVFRAIAGAGGRMKPKKLQLARMKTDEVRALGFIFQHGRMRKRPEDIQSIQNFPEPKSKKELQRFLGAVEWLRRFIPSLANVEAHLIAAGSMPAEVKSHNATVRETNQGKQRFDWNITLDEQAKKSFNDVKRTVANEIELSKFQISDDFETHLSTDASGEAIGAVLMQKKRGTASYQIIGCYSRKLTSAERNYIPQEQELLAIYAAIKHWDFYLEGQKILVWSDHDPLKWMHKMITEHRRGRIMRWFLFLQQFNLEIEHVAGKKNEFADAISRMGREEKEEDLRCLAIRVVGDGIVNEEIINGNLNIIKEQLECPEIIAIRFFLKYGDLPEAWVKANTERARTLKKSVAKRVSSFSEQHNSLFVCPETESNRLVLVVPVSLRRTVMEVHHDSPVGAHRGAKKTLEKLKTRYWWPGMKIDIENYIKSCRKCERTKRSWPEPGDLQPLEVTKMFEHLHIDLIGPLPKTMSGNVYILSAVDRSTKRTVLVPLPNKEARTVARAVVQKIICWHGSAPASIQTDQGTEFINNIIKEMTTLLGIRHISGAAYRPQTNGQVERINLPVEQILSAFTDTEQKTWDAYLDFAMMAINSSVSSATGETPDFLTWGRRSIEPLDLIMGVNLEASMSKEHWLDRLQLAREIAATRNMEYNKRMKDRDDETKKPHNINVGDSVMIRDMKVPSGLSKKLRPKASDVDYEVTKLSGAGNKHVRVQSKANPLDERNVHVARVKKVTEEPEGIFGEQSQKLHRTTKSVDKEKEEEDSDVWEVERILSQRQRKDGKVEYLIRWKGFGPLEDSYVLEQDISAPDAIQEFHRHQQNLKPSYAEVVQRKKVKKVGFALPDPEDGGMIEVKSESPSVHKSSAPLQTRAVSSRGRILKPKKVSD